MNNTSQHIEAAEIITEISKDCEMEVLIENLHELYTSWVLYQDCPGKQHKEDITYTYNVLRNHLKRMETYFSKPA